MPGADRPPSATSGRRAQVLDVLRSATAPLTVTAIAERLGVHPNTVRFHLDSLVAGGRVERSDAERRTTGRPAHLYRAAAGMDPTGPRNYRLLAEVLADGLAGGSDPAGEALRYGQSWGRHHAADQPVDVSGPAEVRTGETAAASLVQLLADLDFAPDPIGKVPPLRIGLRHCPFLELAEAGSELVCLVHLGIMQGALESWGSPVQVDRLQPFAEPDLCVAHLVGRL